MRFEVWRPVIAFMVLATAAFGSCGGHDDTNNVLLGTAAQILIFNGTGASPNDVRAIETVLEDNRLRYSTVNSTALNGMPESQLRKYRLLIFPGGNFIDMGKNLTPGAAANIRSAVQHNLNYLGICGGAFLAGKAAYYNGLNLTSGVTFGFYSAENAGIRKASVAISSRGAPVLEQYWEDGPQLSGWGAVVGKYPDGTPAITEGACGKGWVVLTGVHPEAPEDSRQGLTFNTPANLDNDYAGMLIRAALKGTALPHY